MAEFVKQWNDGENLTVTYTGSGNGQAVFTSDANESIDKEIDVTIRTTKGNNTDSKVVRVKQIGLREVLMDADGELLLSSESETLNALKEWATI